VRLRVEISIKPLVCRIEGRDSNVDDLKFADGAVAAEGANHHGCHWLQRKQLSVQLNLALTLEHKIDLGHLPVIVRSGIRLNVDLVDGGNAVVHVEEGAPRKATRAPHRAKFIQLGNFVSSHRCRGSNWSISGAPLVASRIRPKVARADRSSFELFGHDGSR
jgi:hypothetical protein